MTIIPPHAGRIGGWHRTATILALLLLAITAGHAVEARSVKKGVGWHGGPGNQALPLIGTTWAYSWWHRTYGSMPKGMEFVPMILKGNQMLSKDPGIIGEAKSYGRTLLGFNEPDKKDQADMGVEEALQLWPQLMATGMRLGSPVMAGAADKPDGWLGRFMKQAAERKYRVDFICVHAYLDDYDAVKATATLQRYLESIHKQYGKPIWLTEFALANFWKNKPATAEQQIAFIRQVVPMLERLPFVERYAWFWMGSHAKADDLLRGADLATPDGKLSATGIAYRDAR